MLLQVLLSSVVECWDKLRETSISVLMTLETPLPGITEPAAVEDLVLWARKLVGSPRVRESDAGTPHLYHCSALYGRPCHTSRDRACRWFDAVRRQQLSECSA